MVTLAFIYINESDMQFEIHGNFEIVQKDVYKAFV